MPIQPCPACGQQTPRHLHETSKIAHVNYFRCDSCGHIWTTSKQDGSLVNHITPLPEEPPTAA
jgi:uncharacterized Zn finger protein